MNVDSVNLQSFSFSIFSDSHNPLCYMESVRIRYKKEKKNSTALNDSRVDFSLVSLLQCIIQN